MKNRVIFVLVVIIIALVGWSAASYGARAFKVQLRAEERTDAPVVGEVELYGRSHALVIGIDAYKPPWPRLSNAVKDAELVAEALKAQGFEVTLKKNLTSEELERELKDFFVLKGGNSDARLFVWFAGHGYTLGGEGFLVPSDAPGPGAGAQFRYNALPMRRFGEWVRQAEAKHALAVFDSCFSGTIFDTQRMAPPAAVTRATTLPVRQFVTSGDANQAVSDDGSFRKIFIRALTGEERADANGDGYLTASELGMFLEDRITNLTRSRQTPRYGKLRDIEWDRGDFVFHVASSSAVVERPSVPPPSDKTALPPEGGAKFDDILKAGTEQRQAVERWTAWQSAREKEYEQAQEIDSDAYLKPEQKRAAWERFLSAVSGDNPFSTKDEELRAKAEERARYWKDYKVASVPSTPKKASPAPSDSDEVARDGVYIAYANGVVRDTSTGLEWVAGPDKDMNWDQAKSWVESLNVAGGGWRMPTTKELEGLYNQGSGDRNMTPLLKTTGWWVWSGELAGSSNAWGFYFVVGAGRWDPRNDSGTGRAFAVRSRGRG